MALVDRKGRLVRFTIHPGNAAENPLVPELLDGVQTGELIADKAYDTNSIRELLATRDIVATIPTRSLRNIQIPHDEASYRTRHLVENLFADLKQFRGLATRYCKLGETYTSMVNLAWWCIQSKRDIAGTSRA